MDVYRVLQIHYSRWNIKTRVVRIHYYWPSEQWMCTAFCRSIILGGIRGLELYEFIIIGLLNNGCVPLERSIVVCVCAYMCIYPHM